MKKLRLPLPLRPLAGGSALLELSGSTVAELLDAAVRTHEALRERILDATGNLREAIHVFVDTKDIRELEGIGTPVADGSTVWLLPRVGGGSGSKAA